MDAIAGALITAIVGGLIGYVFGNRRIQYERLYEHRAEVIARLSELLYLMQRGLLAWTNPLQPAGVERHKQLQAAGEAFDEWWRYYYANTIWLDPATCEKVEAFMDHAMTASNVYLVDLNERGYQGSKAGRDASIRLQTEIPDLRRELEDQFRAILHPPPWYYEAPLRFLERIETRKRQTSESVPARTGGSPGNSERPQGYLGKVTPWGRFLRCQTQKGRWYNVGARLVCDPFSGSDGGRRSRPASAPAD